MAKAATATERLGISILRIRLGTQLQRYRLQRGMTQAELAEHSDLSLKYVGEVERGDANTTIEVLERLAAVVGWNPMEALEGLREPLSEGVRLLLLDEVAQIVDRLRNMTRWLQALDPALQGAPPPGAATRRQPKEGLRRLSGARPPRKSRKQMNAKEPKEPETPEPGAES
jgi:transcriptional regulator with XRE-family HTH domain